MTILNYYTGREAQTVTFSAAEQERFRREAFLMDAENVIGDATMYVSVQLGSISDAEIADLHEVAEARLRLSVGGEAALLFGLISAELDRRNYRGIYNADNDDTPDTGEVS